jgi:uncharacterized membrane protein
MSVRLQGHLLLAGAIGAILASLLIFLLPGPEGPTDIGSIPTNVVAVLSGVLLLIGLPAFYRAQARQVGILGLVGVVLLWIAVVSLLLVLTGVQILGLTVPDLIPHPGGEGPPPAAIISIVLGAGMILIGGVIVGITTIHAQVFRASIGWVILIASVLLIPMRFVGGNGLLGTILVNSDLALFYAGLAWAGAAISFPVKPAQVAGAEVRQR